MVDAADPAKFPNAKKELSSLLSSPSLNGIPLLMLFNKNDLPDARPAGINIDKLSNKYHHCVIIIIFYLDEIVEALGVKQMKGREIAYYEISCKDILNIDTTLDWLIKHSK